MDVVVLFFLAFVANTLSALAGGGAGLLQLPVLLMLGLPFPVALATHKIASVALGVGATARHLRSGRFNWRFAIFILACGLPGVLLGTQVILSIPDQWAELALGLLTMGVGVYSWCRPALGQVAERRHRDAMGLLLGGLGLFLIGALNGSLTSGTGLFVTLWLVRWFGLREGGILHLGIGRTILERTGSGDAVSAGARAMGLAAPLAGRVAARWLSGCALGAA